MEAILKKFKLDNQKIILICVVFIIIVYLDCAFLMKIQLSNIKTVKPKIAKLRVDINVFNKSLAESKKTRQQQNLSYMRMLSNDQVPMLLEEISDMAKNNKVMLMQVRQVKDTKKKEEKQLQKQAKAQAKPDDLVPLYIALDLSGIYHDLGKFINSLESIDKFIAVQDMNIKSQLDDPQVQNANLLLKIYVRK